MRYRARYALSTAVLLSFGCNDYTTSSNVGPLQAPNSISSISLDSAIFLDWADNPFESDPQRFLWYRVYSDSFDVANNVCVGSWALEGTTVAHEFLAGALPNGVTRCFAVSAISVEGLESAWSPVWSDTPRPDARNVVAWAFDVDAAHSGFRFWDDANGNGYGDAGELGLVQDGNRTDIDFRVERDVNDTLWIVPIFAGTQVQSVGAVADLTAIDVAPVSGYSAQRVKVLPGNGYVFEIVEVSDVRYGAVRVQHAGSQYMIFDWSFQTDRGNPELAPPSKPSLTGKQVVASR